MVKRCSWQCHKEKLIWCPSIVESFPSLPSASFASLAVSKVTDTDAVPFYDYL